MSNIFSHFKTKNWNDQANNLIKDWQERLRLRDWDVSWSFAADDKSIDSDELGHINYKVYARSAHISLLRPDQYDEDDSKNSDFVFESTIVHELLHLHLAPIFGADEEESSHQVLLEEQAIEAISRALTAARRGKIKYRMAQKK